MLPWKQGKWTNKQKMKVQSLSIGYNFCRKTNSSTWKRRNFDAFLEKKIVVKVIIHDVKDKYKKITH